MNIDIIKTLRTGDEEAILRIGESDVCAVIDWCDGAEQILTAVKDFLPEDYVTATPSRDGFWAVSAGGRPVVEIDFTLKKQEQFIDALNEIIAPEFEMMQFRPIDGDGYSFLVRPAAWWAQAKAEHSDIIEKYFLSTKRLSTYSAKSWLGRFFSKP